MKRGVKYTCISYLNPKSYMYPSTYVTDANCGYVLFGQESSEHDAPSHSAYTNPCVAFK
jgi:hypothetical protein